MVSAGGARAIVPANKSMESLVALVLTCKSGGGRISVVLMCRMGSEGAVVLTNKGRHDHSNENP